MLDEAGRPIELGRGAMGVTYKALDSWLPRSLTTSTFYEYTRIMETYQCMAGMWLVGEDMPRETNRVAQLDRERSVRHADSERSF